MLHPMSSADIAPRVIGRYCTPRHRQILHPTSSADIAPHVIGRYCTPHHRHACVALVSYIASYDVASKSSRPYGTAWEALGKHHLTAKQYGKAEDTYKRSLLKVGPAIYWGVQGVHRGCTGGV